MVYYIMMYIFEEVGSEAEKNLSTFSPKSLWYICQKLQTEWFWVTSKLPAKKHKIYKLLFNFSSKKCYFNINKINIILYWLILALCYWLLLETIFCCTLGLQLLAVQIWSTLHKKYHSPTPCLNFSRQFLELK